MVFCVGNLRDDEAVTPGGIFKFQLLGAVDLVALVGYMEELRRDPTP